MSNIDDKKLLIHRNKSEKEWFNTILEFKKKYEEYLNNEE